MMMLHGEGSGHVQRLAVNLICREFTLLAVTLSHGCPLESNRIAHIALSTGTDHATTANFAELGAEDDLFNHFANLTSVCLHQ